MPLVCKITRVHNIYLHFTCDSSIDKKPINYLFETKVYQLKYVIFTTGIEQNATVAHTKLEQNIMKVDIRSQSPNYFKPGLTYHGKVK